MKEFNMRAVLMGSVIGAMVLASAVAQAAPTTVRQEVKVPFPFTVNGEELAAGTYSISHDDEQGGALLIQGQHESVYVLTTPTSSASAPQDTSLVFTKDGNHYRLAEVWDDAGDGVAVVGTR
jgi:hypothetical protein